VLEFERDSGSIPDGSIFDLALLDRKMLIEFDGPYHDDGRQQDADAEKDGKAQSLGWAVKRVAVLQNAVIEPGVLSWLF